MEELGEILGTSTVHGSRIFILKKIKKFLPVEDGDTIIWYRDEKGQICVKNSKSTRHGSNIITY